MDHFPQAGPSACGVPKSRIPLAVLLAAAAIFTLTNWSLTLGVMQPGPNSDGTNPEQGASRETVADESRDLYGDPLPADAVLRLGTVRLRHADNFSSIAFTPSGETLMTTGRWDPEIRFWDVRTGRLVRTFRGTVGDWPRKAIFSPNGARLAVACDRGGVQLWDVASGLEVVETREPDSREGIVSLAFAPDGRRFVTATFEGAVRLWDADNSGRQRLLFQLGPRERGPHALVFSPDGKLLAFGAGTSIHIYDLKGGVESRKFENAHGDQVLSLAFGPDGKTLFSAGDSEYRDVPGKPDTVECDPRLRMWDVASGKVIREYTDAAPDRGACAAVLSRDGRTLVSRQANSIKLWDVSSGKVRRTIPGFWLPSVASNKPIHIRWAFGGNDLALSPDESLLACLDHPLHTVTLWDTATGRRTLDFPDAHSHYVEGIACSPDGSRIATAGGEDGTVRLWDAASGKPLRTFVIGDSYPCVARSVVFSKDGKSIIAGGHNYKDGQHTGTVHVWDVDSGDVRLELRPGKDVAKVALSHDGSLLAIAASSFSEFFHDRAARRGAPRERTLLIVDAKTGVERRQIMLGGYSKCLAFSADGTMVSVVDKDGAIRTWDVATGKLIHQSSAGREMMSAAIADDGTLAAVSCYRTDQTTLWDLAQGKQVALIAIGNEGNPWSDLAISRDKRLLATASNGGEDNTPEKYSIRLWDLRSHRMLKRFPRPLCNRIMSMEFTPDGRRLISGMSDGTCLVWDVSKL